MRKIILFSALLSFFVQIRAQSNYYDLSIGTTRYFDFCSTYGIACIPEYSEQGIEKIIGDTVINSKHYSIIEWKSEIMLMCSTTISAKKEYFRYENELLYQYSENEDSLIQDFSFSIGDSISKFFSEEDLSSFLIIPPKTIIYDTLVHFTDGSLNKIMWGDDTTHIYTFETTIIPDIQTFIDSILVDRGEVWLLPFGDIQTYYPNKPFYFVDSLGVLFSEWNYRKIALVGVKKSDGRLYGREVDFISNIAEPKTDVKSFGLYQNYPNQFNPKTTIEFTLPKTSDVTLKIFNILGEEVVTLVSDRLSVGTYSYDWDASNMANGIYLYCLETDEYIATKKMILLK